MARHGAGLFAAGAALFACLALSAHAQPRPPLPAPARPTFNKDIAPILWHNCATCHRPDQMGSFSLTTFDEVRPRARQIARAVRSRRMPPWKPERGHGEFTGVRILTDEQITLVERWVEGGSIEGSPGDLPPRPAWSPGWQLGKPDLIVTMPEPYEMAPRGADVFRTFVVPIPIERPRYIRAMEFHPGSFRAAHHANLKIDRTRFSRQWDEREPGPGYHGGGSREAMFPDGHFLGWTPGQSPRISPPGMSWRIEPGSDLVIEMHLMSGAETEQVQASVGLFFTEEAPVRSPYMLRLGRQDLDISPGRHDYVNADAYRLPVDVDVLGVQPHAHFLAKEVRGSATLPDGSVKPLIYIRDWDFHWQDVYELAAPMSLPKGTVLSMRYTYDNSAANPRNPNRPPKRVTFGQTSASEMGSLWLQVLPRSAVERQALDRDFSPKLLADDIAGDEKWLEMNPGDAQIHAELGMCYYEAGRTVESLRHLNEAARLDPSAGRLYDIGRLHLLLKNFAEAAATFTRALSLNPRSSEASYGLGVALDGQGRIDAAIAAYTQALDANLDFADAHFNLARLLAARGQIEAAIRHYREALRLRPEDAEAAAALDRLGNPPKD